MRPPFPDGTIDRFTQNSQYFFLSNFYLHPTRYEDLTFPSTEHAYQAAKTPNIDIRRLILAEPTPARAKARGRSLELPENWDYDKFPIMEQLIEQKFCRGTKLADMLLATDDVLLIEGNYWHDLVWGQCFCPRHNWVGSNRLGGMLMDRRIALSTER
jgi:ribA/ribD-fused uncharacterized protein